MALAEGNSQPGTPGTAFGVGATNLAHKPFFSPSTPAADPCSRPHGPTQPAPESAAPACTGLAARVPPGHPAVPACLHAARPGRRANGCATGRPRGVRCSWWLRIYACPPGHAGRAGLPPTAAPWGTATMAVAMAAARPDTPAQLRATLPATLLWPPCWPGLYPLAGLWACVDMWVLRLGPQGAWK